MKDQLRPALVLLFALTLLTGVIYPLVVTGWARVVFPRQAAGSLVTVSGRVVGSRLVGQEFSDPKYFWGRLSGTTPAYNAQASSGTNLGPSSPKLVESVQARVRALEAADPGNRQPVPIDLVTASASGLDPHISPAAAEYQLRRVARARDLSEDRVRALVTAHTEGRDLGILGEPRVNVLLLNLALDGAR